MSGGFLSGIGNYVEVPSVFDGKGPSAAHRSGFSLAVFCLIEGTVGLYDELVTR